MRQIGKSQQARLKTVGALLAGKKVLLSPTTDMDKEVSEYKNLGFDVEYEEHYIKNGFSDADYLMANILWQEESLVGYILSLKK